MVLRFGISIGGTHNIAMLAAVYPVRTDNEQSPHCRLYCQSCSTTVPRLATIAMFSDQVDDIVCVPNKQALQVAHE